MKKKYIVIAGPTASGKSALGLELAKKLQGALVNCDSIQLYKGFDIGSAKPSLAERQIVPHYLFDIATPDETYDAARYREEARKIIEDLSALDMTPIVVGGTGLYLRFLLGQGFHDFPSDQALRNKILEKESHALYEELKTLDPKRAEQLHPHDRFRMSRALEIIKLTGKTFTEQIEQEEASLFSPAYSILLDIPQAILDERIKGRIISMLAEGWIDEVRGILNQGYSPSIKPLQSIGYLQIVEYLQQRLSRDELVEKIFIATRRFSLKQKKLFKRFHFDRIIASQEEMAAFLEQGGV